MSKRYKNSGEIPQSSTNYAIKAYLVNENISNLLGKVLTIVDASTEGDKNKAMKDLIRQVFEEKQNWIWEMSWFRKDQNIPMSEWVKGLVEVPFESSSLVQGKATSVR